MLSRQQEEQDRIRTLRNDLSVREQQGRVFAQDQSLPNKASTLHQHALADADTPRGRFSAVETAYVVGSKADVAASYPAAAAHQFDIQLGALVRMDHVDAQQRLDSLPQHLPSSPLHRLFRQR